MTAFRQKTIGNPETLRRLNRQSILALLRSAGPMSRTEVSRRTRLGWGSVTKYANELIAEGYITERADPAAGSDRGRPPGLLEMNNDRHRLIGVELNDHITRMVICDFSGNPLALHSYPTNADAPAEAINRKLIRELRAFINRHLEGRNLFAIGASVAGGLDWEEGIVTVCANIPHYQQVPLGPILQREFGCRVHMAVTMRTVTFGEQVIGHAGDTGDFLVVYLGYGIGSSIVIDHRTYPYQTRGCDCGHYIVEPGGTPCVCGMRGCLEAEAGIHALLAQLPDSDFAAFVRNVRRGDPETLRVLNRAIRHIAETTAVFIQFHRPELLILHGELTELGPLLLNPLRELIAARLPERLFRPEKLIISEFQQIATPVGAADLVWRRELGEEPDCFISSRPVHRFHAKPLPETERLGMGAEEEAP